MKKHLKIAFSFCVFMKTHWNPWKYSAWDNQLQQITCSWTFHCTSLKWLVAIQINWKSSAVCPIMPVPAKTSSKTVPLRIYLLYAGKSGTLQPRNISGIPEVIKTEEEQDAPNWCLQDYSPTYQSPGSTQCTCAGSLPVCLVTSQGQTSKNAGLPHHFFCPRTHRHHFLPLEKDSFFTQHF